MRGTTCTPYGVLVLLLQVPAVHLAGTWGMRGTLVAGALFYAAAYLLFGAGFNICGNDHSYNKIKKHNFDRTLKQ